MSARFWRCDVCGQPIRNGTGYIEIAAVSEDGVVGGFPQVPTPDPELPEPPDGWPGGVRMVSAADLANLPLVTPRIAYRVLHLACDPNPDSSSYRFDVGRARTLAEWVAWVQHMGTKGWMGRHDLLAMLDLWWTNRRETRPNP